MILRVTMIVSLFLAITGCGPRFVYPQLDWLVPWYVDDYLSLNDLQQDEFSARLSAQLEWHCRTQMPRYAGFLREIQQEVAAGQPITEEALSVHYASLRRYVGDLAIRVGPDLARILATADDSQVDELFKNIDKRNRELAKKYLSPPSAERTARRRDRMIGRLERWTGTLGDGQRQAVQLWSADADITGHAWMENRLRVQARFRALIDNRNQDPAFIETFTHMLADPERLRSPEYHQLVVTNRSHTLELLKRIGNSLTPAQRSHLAHRLSAMADDFDDLSCPIPETTPSPDDTAPAPYQSN